MADFSTIIQEINNEITTNGVGAITGAKLNEVLRDMIAAVNAEKQDELQYYSEDTADERVDIGGTASLVAQFLENILLVSGNWTIGNYGGSENHILLSNISTGTQLELTENAVEINANGDIVFRVSSEDGVTINGESVAVVDDIPNVSGKADKVSGATNGNFAGLDASGNITDSGSKASDFATAAQGTKADTAYQKPSGGIPASDLAAAVQTSLGKADTAVQQVMVGTTTTGNAGTNASVTNSGTATAPVLNFTIPRGADGANGQDGADAVNPFKGWYASSNALPANPVVGDYAYVKGANASDPAAIYECTTAGTWSDSGRTADTSNVQTFASGEEVNDVHIVNDFTTGGVDDVLSAESGKNFKETMTEEEIVSANLLNPNVYEIGALDNNGNLMTNGVYATYTTSDFIKLEENTDYYYAVYSSTTPHLPSTQRKICLLFDANKQPINDSHQNASGDLQLTFNTSTNAKYVRVSSGAQILDGFSQVSKGTVAGGLVPFSTILKSKLPLADEPLQQVTENVLDTIEIIDYETGKNLANPDTMTVGAIQSDGTVSTSGAWNDYITTDYIEINADENYVASQWSSQMILNSTRMLLLLFDEDKVPITVTYQNVESTTYLTFSNASAKYVRVSTRSFNILQVEKGSVPTEFEAFSGKNVLAYPLGGVPMAQTQSGNPLYKKKWAVCGDSFTNGATANTLTEGKYKGYKIVYPYIIGNRNEMEIVKHFAGGQTLANPSDGTFTNSLTNSNNPLYYQNIPADADYITIYLGINDENHYRGWSPDGEITSGYIELGTIDDVTSATYYGAWNEVLTWLITNRPFAHIGIIVCNGLSASEYNGISGRDWRDAQIAIAEKYGVPYIDLNGDKQTPAMIRSVNPKLASNIKTVIDQKQAVDYPTNTHPNDDAHLFESTFIENFLRSI